jgi:hypothetical protein
VAFAPEVAATPIVEATAPVAAPAGAAVAVAERPTPAATVAVQMPAQVEKKKPLRRGFLWLAAALVLVLLLGTAAVLLDKRTTLQLTPSRIEAGGSVTVVAQHVPGNQAGEIQLHSVLHAYPFRANGSGDVRRDIVIPSDTPTGDHVVAICWSGSCHAQQTLQVVSGVALVSPATSPGGGAGPSPSTSPGTTPISSPGTTPSPKPGTSPTSNPTRPASSPSPIPSPSVNPCPTPAPPAALSPASKTVVGGQQILYTGSHFTPNTSVTLTYRRKSATGALWTSWSVTVDCSGGFTTSVKTPTGVAETDYVRACDVTNGCFEAKITLLL